MEIVEHFLHRTAAEPKVGRSEASTASEATWLLLFSPKNKDNFLYQQAGSSRIKAEGKVNFPLKLRRAWAFFFQSRVFPSVFLPIYENLMLLRSWIIECSQDVFLGVSNFLRKCFMQYSHMKADQQPWFLRGE